MSEDCPSATESIIATAPWVDAAFPADGEIFAVCRPGPDPARPARPPAPDQSFALVLGDHQEVELTASRRSQPRAWLRAVHWLLDARAHPKAGEPTARVAADLTSRMDYINGVVLYDLRGTATRLAMDRSTVKRHVRVLRELGALAWARHGTKKNLHLPGRPYTATATIYAAVIPAAYDTAVGHRLSGIGYNARVIGLTERGRALATEHARTSRPRQRPPERRAPQSLGSTRNQRSVEVEGRKRATPTPHRPTAAPRTTVLGRSVTASAYQEAEQTARALRPLHPWLQRATIPELSWVLLDTVIDGWHHDRVRSWLAHIAPAIQLSSAWRPTRPHAYIASQLRRDQALHQYTQDLAKLRRSAVPPNPAFLAARASCRRTTPGAALPVLDGTGALTAQQITDLRREAAEELILGSPDLVTTTYALLGLADTTRLYGSTLVDQCLKLAFSRPTLRADRPRYARR